MPRPKKYRCVTFNPSVVYFKPRGIPLVHLDQVSLSLDELEAIRLADHEGLYHEEGAARMGVSRPTFGRIISAARKKVAEAIVEGKALKIDQNITKEEVEK